MQSANFLLAGVGGQGTLLASDIIAQVGLCAGRDVKKADVHGMAQRGGAVVSHVRWGECVASPLCERGQVDYFVAQEMLESLRWIEYLKLGGVAIVSQQRIVPASTVFGEEVYPDMPRVEAVLAQATPHAHLVDALGAAEKLGNMRVANIVLLGALSRFLDVSAEDWLQVVLERVPARHAEINRMAFEAGRQNSSS
jgi:indolepyruvate ferredoxin oxidoreductase, beta subunit